jgi:DnaJ like chaperone protein
LADPVSRAEVKLAYQGLAQKYHPDKVASLAPEFGALAEEKMKQINAAYKVLSEGA